MLGLSGLEQEEMINKKVLKKINQLSLTGIFISI
jgi:hypothetical protein